MKLDFIVLIEEPTIMINEKLLYMSYNCTTVQGRTKDFVQGGGVFKFFFSPGGLTPIGLETPQGTMHFTDLGVGGGRFR